MDKKYPIKLLNGNIESTEGLVKKWIGSPRTYNKGNEQFMYLQPFGLFSVKMAIFMNNKKRSILTQYHFRGTRINKKKFNEPSEM
jgi:hypothetical protein